MEQGIAKRYAFGLKAEFSKSRISDFSSLVVIVPRALCAPPTGLHAEAGNESVELRWEAPTGNIDGSQPAGLKGYNVYRSEAGTPAVRLNSSLGKDSSFSDKTFVFGTEYVYTVRAAANEAEPFAESVDSAPAVVLPLDIFPPKAPAGLTVLAGPDFISLSWDAVLEGNLAGYRVWRRAAGRPEYKELTEAAVKESTFQDRSAKPGIRYEYVVAAEDMAGNKSPNSDPVSGQLREIRN